MSLNLQIRLFGFLPFFGVFFGCRSNNEIVQKPIVAIQMQERISFPASSSLSERLAGSNLKASENGILSLETHKSTITEKVVPLHTDVKEDSWMNGRLMLQSGLLTDALRVAKIVYENLERVQPLTSKLSLEDDAKNAYLFIAETMLAFKNYKKEGIQILEKLIELEPKWEQVYLSLAKPYMSEGANALAERILLRVLDRVEVPSEQTFLSLARVQKNQNRVDRSMQTMALAKSSYPKSALPEFWQAVVDFENGEMFASCQSFYKTFDSLRDMPAAHYNVALCYLREGNIDAADKIVLNALQQFSDQPGFKLLAGVVAQKKGDSVKARRVWNEYLLMTDDRTLTTKVTDALKRLN